MRKKKSKYANVIMLLLILFVLFVLVLQDKSIKVTADELVNSYSLDISASDKRFLNKEIELTGGIKSFLQFESDKSLLELRTTSDELKLYCILMNKETEAKASTLTAGTYVTVYGKCLGIKNFKFPNSIYIEVEQIK
ncbi:MAG: OB-fold putative lipoprotein [Ignavibacteriaceae bacterium]|nr:OB-fold putative lipoprotein [Ignavibacteriaceae bacterium]